MAARAEGKRAGAQGGWVPRAVAAVAGAFLVWRGTLGGLVPLVAGALVLRRAFPGAAARRRRGPEVVEVKSPAELERGIASASQTSTFSPPPRSPPRGTG